eukprot:3877475-Ditylum_brightwellii.AAC.1
MMLFLDGNFKRMISLKDKVRSIGLGSCIHLQHNSVYDSDTIIKDGGCFRIVLVSISAHWISQILEKSPMK